MSENPRMHLGFRTGGAGPPAGAPTGAAAGAPAGTPAREPVGLDPADLLTHAVCLGATGSGKTGLLIALLEEASLAGVPILALDPKGDLTNLALVFPELAPADFARGSSPTPRGGPA